MHCRGSENPVFLAILPKSPGADAGHPGPGRGIGCRGQRSLSDKRKVICVNAVNTRVFAVGSVTNAMRGRELLRRQGISAFLGRADAGGREGCGYTLAVTGETDRAAAILTAAGIRIRPAP